MKYYYAFDGDQVGRKLQIRIMKNDIVGAGLLSASVSEAVNTISRRLETLGCEIIFSGGDSVLATSESRINTNLLDNKNNNMTFSVGIGNSPRNSLIALSSAKLIGSGAVYEYLGEDT